MGQYVQCHCRLTVENPRRGVLSTPSTIICFDFCGPRNSGDSAYDATDSFAVHWENSRNRSRRYRFRYRTHWYRPDLLALGARCRQVPACVSPRCWRTGLKGNTPSARVISWGNSGQHTQTRFRKITAAWCVCCLMSNQVRLLVVPSKADSLARTRAAACRLCPLPQHLPAELWSRLASTLLFLSAGGSAFVENDSVHRTQAAARWAVRGPRLIDVAPLVQK
jgi:hypothetical protein